MNTCIVTIGNEILDGSRLDTNSQWIAKKIIDYGLVVNKIISVGDNQIDICETFKDLTDKYEFIFITGGLGPTHDDITVSCFAEVFNLKSTIDQNYFKILEGKFSDRNIKMPEINKNQALTLKDTTILANSLGTARGIYYKYSKSRFFIMPGVPHEMYHIMEDVIIPSYLGSKINISCKVIRTAGIAESKLTEKVQKLMSDNSQDFNFSFLPSYKGVDFVLKSYSENNAFKATVNQFYNAMSPYSFGYGEDSFLKFIIGELLNKKISISLAESCTGGFLGKMLTDVPGSSEVFSGGVIAYSNSIKIDWLNVPKGKIEKYGAVSSEVAEEMALNIKSIFKSSIGVSITGIAGPLENLDDKNIGLVYIGIAFKNKCISKKFNFNLNRDLNRKLSCYTALNMVRKIINE